MSMPAKQPSSTPALDELLRDFAIAPAVPIYGIASDSRRLAEGYLFLACQGAGRHGLDFLDDAIAAGAAAVACDPSTAGAPQVAGIPLVAVAGLESKLGEIANRYYGRPSETLRVIGVTGTNGKTTVAWLVAQCAQLLGERCGYIGTLGYGVDEVRDADGMTTPAAVELHGRLAGFVEEGARFAALEVSSHALSQARVAGVRFAAALFTNLTRDHLDYHADMQDYFETKARLFLEADTATRIVNVDSDYGARLVDRCGLEVVTVSTRFDRVANGRPYVFARSVVADTHGSTVTFVSSWGEGRFTLPLPGDFNVANAMLVLAVMLQQGVSLQAACDVLSRVQAPPGRMQRVAGPGSRVYVDYAHTPDALDVALSALRQHSKGRLWCVFGCGGDRDQGKRALMARVAERLADRVVVTSDNPRTEKPEKIIEDIMAGLSEPRAATAIEDRAAAIAWTIRQAADTDVVLIAGKGHEDYQETGGKRLPFSDYDMAAAALQAIANGDRP
ncbi:MAG: UDP-N-acetylmuramoyl-L-alanyl-D-glutamate--2,6-diaminopimelate ligase [Woeseiaceae bacterium]|nr:UDP-N-acetylmuramoyl-L-alanyl-D-glutamate--2,6-diaminopimelate ligase [Woeseiaceae bacterium]